MLSDHALTDSEEKWSKGRLPNIELNPKDEYVVYGKNYAGDKAENSTQVFFYCYKGRRAAAQIFAFFRFLPLKAVVLCHISAVSAGKYVHHLLCGNDGPITGVLCSNCLSLHGIRIMKYTATAVSHIHSKYLSCSNSDSLSLHGGWKGPFHRKE